jgi:hypothetical protein
MFYFHVTLQLTELHLNMNWSLFNIGGETKVQQVIIIFWFIEVLKSVIEFPSSTWSMWQLLLSALALCTSIALWRNVHSLISLSVLKIKAVSWFHNCCHTLYPLAYEDGTDSVPKHWQLNFICWRTSQKKNYDKNSFVCKVFRPPCH